MKYYVLIGEPIDDTGTFSYVSKQPETEEQAEADAMDLWFRGSPLDDLTGVIYAFSSDTPVTDNSNR